MINKIRSEIKEYFVGKDDVIDYLLICLLTGGHVLLEDVPGVGKTTLASTLAKSLDCDFGRIQFTPDTLPTDVCGTEIFNMKSGEFEYRKGSIMHQIVLADEINRTSPKTQASLLEAMAEGQVTVGGTEYKLPEPFMVIATENPVEFMGTFPLPEAELDRFMMQLSIGYPSEEEELRMVSNFINGKTVDKILPLISSEDVLRLKEEVSKVTIKDNVLAYSRNIINDTRNEKRFVLGASPRALLQLIKASMGKAYLDGRDYVKPDDVKEMAYPVLRHRLMLTSEAKIAGEDSKKIIASIVNGAKIPN